MATRLDAYQIEPGASGQVVSTTFAGIADWVDPSDINIVVVDTASAAVGNVPVWTASGWVASGAVATGGGGSGGVSQSDADDWYVNASGDTMWGDLTLVNSFPYATPITLGYDVDTPTVFLGHAGLYFTDGSGDGSPLIAFRTNVAGMELFASAGTPGQFLLPNDPVFSDAAVRRSYMASAIASAFAASATGIYVEKSGDTMTGDLVIDDAQVTVQDDAFDNSKLELFPERLQFTRGASWEQSSISWDDNANGGGSRLSFWSDEFYFTNDILLNFGQISVEGGTASAEITPDMIRVSSEEDVNTEIYGSFIYLNGGGEISALVHSVDGDGYGALQIDSERINFTTASAEIENGLLFHPLAPNASAVVTNRAYVDAASAAVTASALAAIAASGGMSMGAADARYVNASGDTMTGSLLIQHPNYLASAAIWGASGALLSLGYGSETTDRIRFNAGGANGNSSGMQITFRDGDSSHRADVVVHRTAPSQVTLGTQHQIAASGASGAVILSTPMVSIMGSAAVVSLLDHPQSPAASSTVTNRAYVDAASAAVTASALAAIAASGGMSVASADARYLQFAAAASAYLSLDNAASAYIRLNDAASAYIDVTGDTMRGDLVMASGSRVTLGTTIATASAVTVPNDPTASGHAANQAYLMRTLAASAIAVASADARYVNITGDTMTGPLGVQASAHIDGIVYSGSGFVASDGTTDNPRVEISAAGVEVYASGQAERSYLTHDMIAFDDLDDYSTYWALVRDDSSGAQPVARLNGTVAASASRIRTSVDPDHNDDLVRMGWVNSSFISLGAAASAYVSLGAAASAYVDIAGDTMRGNLVMASGATIQLGTTIATASAVTVPNDPTASGHATNQAYTTRLIAASGLALSSAGAQYPTFGAVASAYLSLGAAASAYIRLADAASAYVDITGDTMTGNLTVLNSTATVMASGTTTNGLVSGRGRVNGYAVAEQVSSAGVVGGQSYLYAGASQAGLALVASSASSMNLETNSFSPGMVTLSCNVANTKLYMPDASALVQMDGASAAIYINGSRVLSQVDAVATNISVTQSGIIIPSATNVQQALAQVEAYVQNLEERFEEDTRFIVAPSTGPTADGSVLTSDATLGGSKWSTQPLGAYGALMTLAGLKGATYDPLLADQFASSMNDGTVYFAALYVQSAATLTGVTHLQAVTSTNTSDNNTKVGLYTSDGSTLTLVASCANDANIFKATAGTAPRKAFTTPYVAQPGIYYVALLANWSGAGTAPSLYYANAPTAAVLANSGGYRGMSIAAQADLPATQLLSGTTIASTIRWVGVY